MIPVRWRDLPIAVIDTETTGIDADARIVEIAAVVVRGGEVTSRWCRRLNPGIPIPEGASAVHGIHDADVADAPLFGDVAGELAQFVAACHPAAFNAPFDRRIIGADCGRFPAVAPPIDLDMVWLDPLVWAWHVDKYQRGKKLSDVAQRRGISIAGAHGALADCEMAVAVMFALGKHPDVPEDLEELLAWQEAKRAEQEADRAAWRARQGARR